MIISDALPVQFWSIDCETFNEKEVFGINHKCFCQSFLCTDEIKFQFQDDVVDTYYLLVYDEGDNLLDTIPFVPTPGLSLAPLTAGQNYGSGTSWTIDADPNVATTSASKIVRFAITSARPGELAFHYDLRSNTNLSYDGGIIYIRLYDADMNVLDSLELTPGTGGEDHIGDITFNASSTPFYIGISLTTEAGGMNLRVDELTLLTAPYDNNVYNLTFNPSINTPDFCDLKVYFVIRRGASTQLAHSDCVYLAAELEGTVLIAYSNHRNYAGLIAQNGSPDLTFYLRIFAVFAQEQYPETDEVLQLSNNRIISLNSQVKKQRLLDTDQMPMYMHLKLKEVLKHQFVTIDDVDYVKEEPYEPKSNSNRRYPFRAYTCWLTEKEYVVRNIL